MIDVHHPHQPVHGWRDFFVHLVTITIGLLIALGLEGYVEWLHHLHLAHEARTSLHAEIAGNAKDITKAAAQLHEREKDLKSDVAVLKYVIKNKKMPEHAAMSIDFDLIGLNDVSWKTAQSTGAVTYMAYAEAQDYSDIYNMQAELYASEQQAARDAIISLAPFLDPSDGDPDPTPEEAAAIEQKIEILQGQLLMVDSLLSSLGRHYQQYLTAHPHPSD